MLLGGSMAMAFGLTSCVRRSAHRFRLRVDTVIDGVRYNDFTVLDFIASYASGPIGTPESMGWKFDERGEAIFLDIGKGQNLVVSFLPPHGAQLVDIVRPVLLRLTGRVDYDDLSPFNNDIELRPEEYPMLMTFADPSRPDSVRILDPANLSSGLNRTVSQIRLSLQLTKERRKGKIAKELPWIDRPELRSTMLSGKGPGYVMVKDRHLLTDADKLSTRALRAN